MTTNVGELIATPNLLDIIKGMFIDDSNETTPEGIKVEEPSITTPVISLKL
jgi:hypothetical protein